jgi:hypothetical protein
LKERKTILALGDNTIGGIVMYTNYNKMRYNSEEEKEVFETPQECYLAPIPEIPKPKEPVKATIVNCKKLNVRKSNDIKSDVLVVIDNNSELLVEEVCGDWTHVYTASGIPGYVMSKYIKT